MIAKRCGAVAAGLLLDRLAGEPPAGVHPVARFGRAMERVEERLWADSRMRGIIYVVLGVALGALAGRLLRSTPAVVALAVAGRELRLVAGRVGDLAGAGDIAAARAELPALVGRDPSELDSSGVAAAVIESLAENSVDAVIAPAFWAVVAGALGRELGGALRYGPTVETRPRLGSGPRPTPADIPHAIAIAAKVEAIVVALLVLGWLVGTGRLSR